MLKRSKGFLWILGTILLLLDQAIKLFVLRYYSQIISYNSGIFFGSIQNITLMYIFLVIGVIILFFLFIASNKKFSLPLTIIAAGAISNIIDRILYLGVLDYINLEFWSNFNLADIYILVGAIWYLQKLLFDHKNKSKLT